MRPILIAALLCATTLARVAHADDPKIEFEKYKLPNGMEVILSPDDRVPLVAVHIWYHVGSGNEVPGKSGFAHLFEHVMFQGSKNTGKDMHFEIMRKIGSTELNGTTNTDRTNYFETVPSQFLETALWVESDRMGHLLDFIQRKDVDEQIDVVRNERRQNYDNVPFRKALFALYAALYPEGHPYRYLTIGKHEDLTSATMDDVTGFFKTWYVPSNATLAIVGDFKPAEAKELIQKWFGSYPASEKPKTVVVPAPTVKAQTITVDDSFAKQRQIVFAWHSPAMFAAGDAELDIAANALGAEGRGRLYKALVLDNQLATRVSASQDGASFSGTFDVTVTLRSEADLEQVKKIVVDEVAKVTKENLSDKEIQRVVTASEASAIYRLESLNNRAYTLQTYNQFLGDPGKLSWDLDRYRKATADGIRGYAAKYLMPSSMVTIITNPTGGAK
ncbi:MAG TPA: pitrilysin family protein [Kofleriaceae bacterium]|nr:pitrilysin family protein [Kofleriaceae bacterium]